MRHTYRIRYKPSFRRTFKYTVYSTYSFWFIKINKIEKSFKSLQDARDAVTVMKLEPKEGWVE